MSIVLTKEEEITTYCEDFCPIEHSIKEYNSTHEHNIYCSTEMCENIKNAYVLNMRKKV